MNEPLARFERSSKGCYVIAAWGVGTEEYVEIHDLELLSAAQLARWKEDERITVREIREDKLADYLYLTTQKVKP